jgi:hypothetical protein
LAGHGRWAAAGEVVLVSVRCKKTVKTGMSPGDEKSYLAEYGGIVEIHPLCFGVVETRDSTLLIFSGLE